MNRKAKQELHEMTLAQLQKKLDELLNEHAQKRLERAAGKLENPAQVTHLGKSIARIKTIMTEKRLLEKVAAK